MRLLIDTSVLIASERRNQSCPDLLDQLQSTLNVRQALISTISVMELTHGIYRARTSEQRFQREAFIGQVLSGLDALPITTSIAQLAGQIEGEQAVRGVKIDTADLLIGATALIADCDVLTANIRHFERIPNLRVVPFTL